MRNLELTDTLTALALAVMPEHEHLSVEEAEISGTYEGELTVRNRLLIRSTGQVKGTVRYGELEIERGGKLSGSVSMLEPGGKLSGPVPVRESSAG